MAEEYENTDINETRELDELSRKLISRYRDHIDHVTKWRREAREDYEFYNGDQWAAEDKRLLRDQKRPALTFNRIGPLVNAVVGSEINNRREVQFLPREQGDAIGDEMLTAAGEWFRDEGDAEDEESSAFEDTTISGMGWVDTTLNYEAEPDGKPEVRRLDNLKMVWDSNAKKPNLIDGEIAFYVDSKPYSEVKEMFPDVAREMLHAGWANNPGNPGDPHDQDMADRYEGGQEEFVGQNDRKLCTLVEARWFEKEPYFRGPDIQTGEPREYSSEQMKLINKQYPDFPVVRQYRKVVKRAFLGVRVLAKPDKPLVPPGMLGWECITGYHDKMENQFYGIVRPAKDPQRWSNKFLSQTQFLLNSQSKGGVMMERGAVENELDFETSWAKSDAVTYVKTGTLSGPGPKVMPKPVAQFPTGFFTLFQESKESISDVTGLSAEFIGTREVDQAGVLEYQRRQSSLNLLASLFNSLRRYRKRQGKIVLYLIQNYLSDGRLIRVVGDDDAQYVPLMKSDKTNIQYDIIVDDAPTSPNEREKNWAIIQQMLPMLQPYLEADPEIALEVLAMSPIQASLISKLRKKLQAKKEAEAQRPPQPSPEEMAMEFEKAKAELDIQGKQADLETQAQKNQMEIQKSGIELFLKSKEAENEQIIANQRLQVDLNKLALQEESNRIRAQNANANRTSAAK